MELFARPSNPLWKCIINKDTIWQEYKLRQKTSRQLRHAQQLAAHMDKNECNEVTLITGRWTLKRIPNPLLNMLMVD